MVGHPGEDDESDSGPWWALALKVGLAMALADGVARLFGVPGATLAVITAAFISARPPATSIGMGLRRWLAAMLGVALGLGAGWAVRTVGGLPALAPLAIGLIAGGLCARSSDYLYVAVAGIVVAFTLESTERNLLEVGLEKALLVTIGCVAAPLVVLAVDRLRGRATGGEG